MQGVISTNLKIFKAYMTQVTEITQLYILIIPHKIMAKWYEHVYYWNGSSN